MKYLILISLVCFMTLGCEGDWGTRPNHYTCSKDVKMKVQKLYSDCLQNRGSNYSKTCTWEVHATLCELKPYDNTEETTQTCREGDNEYSSADMNKLSSHANKVIKGLRKEISTLKADGTYTTKSNQNSTDEISF